jgi:ABC-type dipeptide/oligopeptide/nickel transport system permease subunit
MIASLVKSVRGAVGVTLVGLLALTALLAPLVAPYDPVQMDASAALTGPSGLHLLGTDMFGRDMLSRIIFGARTTLGIALASVLIAALSGSLLGILSGFFGGTVDNIIMRATDVLRTSTSLSLWGSSTPPSSPVSPAAPPWW